MLYGILITIVVLIAIFFIVVATRPSDFRVERSATISAPPSAVFAQVNDFHNWDAWSPWAKIDPNSKTTFEGPSSGNGASFTWSGNNKVGEGRMTIVDSRPSELIKIDLVFVRPFKGANTAEFTFKLVGNQTQVTWANYGKANFVSKVFCMIINQDKMLGGYFEKGLAQMKAVTESAVAA